MRPPLTWVILGSILAGAGSAAGQANLIVNGGGESDVGSSDGYTPAAISTWSQFGSPNVVKYTAGGGFPTPTDPGPDSRGSNFFTGGATASVDATLSQAIDVSGSAVVIDDGTMPFTLCGFLGGFGSQEDNATVEAVFVVGDTAIGNASIGPVLPADRHNETSLCLRSTSGTVPPGTRTVMITVTFNEEAGPYNDGYADNLTFVFSPTCPETGGGCGATTTSTSTSTVTIPTTLPGATTTTSTLIPGTPTTTTSTLTPGTPTTTTVPNACTPAATFASIRCRLEALLDDVRTTGDLGALQAKLQSLVSDALAKATSAETATSARQRKNLLKAVAKKLGAFSARVRSRKGRKTIPAATGSQLTDAANAIRTDVLTLRRAP